MPNLVYDRQSDKCIDISGQSLPLVSERSMRFENLILIILQPVVVCGEAEKRLRILTKGPGSSIYLGHFNSCLPCLEKSIILAYVEIQEVWED